MTGPVRPTSPADQAWADLGAQLTPAASLARIDAVTARAITTITVIGVLLTGLGALAAGQFAHHGAARGLAAATVITATLAVACALAAQVLTITRRLNPANLADVQAAGAPASSAGPTSGRPANRPARHSHRKIRVHRAGGTGKSSLGSLLAPKRALRMPQHGSDLPKLVGAAGYDPATPRL